LIELEGDSRLFSESTLILLVKLSD
jgi:hypothetical protein